MRCSEAAGTVNLLTHQLRRLGAAVRRYNGLCRQSKLAFNIDQSAAAMFLRVRS